MIPAPTNFPALLTRPQKISLGIDHEKLTDHHKGRNFRLTDVGGHVIHDVIA